MTSEKDKYPYIRRNLVKHEKNILNVPEIVGRFIVGLVPFMEQLRQNNLSSAQIRDIIAFIYTWKQTKDRTEYFRNFIRRNRRLLYHFIVDNKIKSYTFTGFQFQTFEAIGLAARSILEGKEESAPVGTSDALNSNPQTAAWEANEGDGGSERNEEDRSDRNQDECLEDPAISLSARTSLEGGEESAPVGTGDALNMCPFCHKFWHPRQSKIGGLGEWLAMSLSARTSLDEGERSEPVGIADTLNSNLQTAARKRNHGDGGSERKEKDRSKRNREKQLDDPDESHNLLNLSPLQDGLESSTNPPSTSEDKRKELPEPLKQWANDHFCFSWNLGKSRGGLEYQRVLSFEAETEQKYRRTSEEKKKEDLVGTATRGPPEIPSLPPLTTPP